MMVAEIRTNAREEWIGQFHVCDSGLPLGLPWRAESRSELIAKMSRVVPAARLSFRDVFDPLDP
jgi:hypothetical protein